MPRAARDAFSFGSLALRPAPALFLQMGLILYPGSGHPVLTDGRGRRGFHLGSILGGIAVSVTDEQGNAVAYVPIGGAAT
jgi:hypothetical protein